MRPSSPFLFTDKSIDDLPPKALATLFAVHPSSAMTMVMAVAHNPFMVESALRGFEDGVFDLNVDQANERGADLGASNPFNGFTALHGAAQNGNAKTVDFLIQIGLNEKAKDVFGYTPRQWWQDRSMKNANEFDCVIQVGQARKAMDGILASAEQKKSP